MSLKESDNKYARAFWGIIPHIVILLSFIIIAWSMSQSSTWEKKIAKDKADASISTNNKDLIKLTTKAENSKEISNIFFYGIPGIVIISDIIIIRYWKKKNKDTNK